MKYSRYTFGTDNIASTRLEKLAAVFNPYSAEFIKQHAGKPVATAADLGCGPGFTTHMLYMSVDSKEVYGFDNSEAFLQNAMERFTQCVFVRQDLTRMPFPLRPELMYARFVLSHLPDPVAVVNAWSQELDEGGLLLIEEVEDVMTGTQVFNKYLSVNRGLVASQGAKLYAGKELSRGRYDAEILYNRSVEMPVTNSDAAGMFYPNTVGIWKRDEYAQKALALEEREEVSGKLLDMMNSGSGASDITWKMRRIVLRKTGHYHCFDLFI